MLKNLFLPVILIILAYGFWISPNFKEISSGVAIFLLGMLSLEQGFKAFSGGLLENFLKTSTDKTYKSLFFGVVTTTLMQSSSLVSILTISFLGAGLIGLSQGIGIVLGASIGTTTGTWLIAGFGLKVDIASYAMPMLVFGVIFIFQKSTALKGLGYILTGIGFLFLGIHYMKEGFEAFKNTIDLSHYSVGGIKGLLIFTIIGMVATIVMQSSHASLVLIITALAAGQISYENALALTIGASIGTTVSSILGSLGSNIDGKRLAIAYLIFNVLTGLAAMIFIYQLIYLVDIVAIKIGLSNDNYPLKLAIFHTIFNTTGVLIMLPFVNKLVTFLETTIKEKPSNDEMGFDSVKYLNSSALEFPESSIGAIILETKHLYENAFEIIAHGLNLNRKDIVSSMDLDEVIKGHYSKKYIDIDKFYNHKIKDIYGEILDFAIKAQSNANTKPEHTEEIYKLKLANRDMVEAIKDTKHLQKNLIKYSANPNKYIKEEYSNIKKSLAELLRDINVISSTNEEDEIVLLISKAKVHTQKHNIIANGTLDNLIRNNLISNQMATSLMNDSTYAYNIRKNLINMAEVLFINKSSNVKSVHEDMMVNENDVNLILEKKD